MFSRICADLACLFLGLVCSWDPRKSVKIGEDPRFKIFMNESSASGFAFNRKSTGASLNGKLKPLLGPRACILQSGYIGMGFLEAPSGLEPLNRGFADLSLSHLGTAPYGN
jgi:hypothetical protein